MISIVFIDARDSSMLQRIEPEVKINLVQQYMIAVLLEEDATDNSFERGLPGLGRLSKRQLAYGSRKLSRIKGGSRYLSKRIKKMRKNKKKN